MTEPTKTDESTAQAPVADLDQQAADAAADFLAAEQDALDQLAAETHPSLADLALASLDLVKDDLAQVPVIFAGQALATFSKRFDIPTDTIDAYAISDNVARLTVDQVWQFEARRDMAQQAIHPEFYMASHCMICGQVMWSYVDSLESIGYHMANRIPCPHCARPDSPFEPNITLMDLDQLAALENLAATAVAQLTLRLAREQLALEQVNAGILLAADWDGKNTPLCKAQAVSILAEDEPFQQAQDLVWQTEHDLAQAKAEQAHYAHRIRLYRAWLDSRPGKA